MSRFALIALLAFGVVPTTASAAAGTTTTTSTADATIYNLFTYLAGTGGSFTGSAKTGTYTARSYINGTGMTVDLYDARGTRVGSYDLDSDGTVTLGGSVTSANVSVNKLKWPPKKVTVSVTWDDGKLTILVTIE